MRAQLDDAHERGEPLAALWASEETIYGRFGYGLASFCGEITLAHEYTSFAQPFEPQGTIRLIERRRGARGRAAGLRAHPARVARHVLAERAPGGSSARSPIPKSGATARGRSAGSSTSATARPRATRPTGTSRASTRARRTRSCASSRRLATTPEALRDLWALPACRRLDRDASTSSLLPPDHPLFLLLATPRRLRYRMGDGLWVRLVDVGAALSGRKYSRTARSSSRCATSSVRGTRDGGRSTEAAPNAAEDARRPRRSPCSRSARRCSAASRSRAPARRPRRELEAGALERADALFRRDRHPWCPEIF